MNVAYSCAGGAGFLGKPIHQKLAQEFAVVAPDRKELDLQQAAQLDLLAGEEEIDCLIHLANPRVYTSNIALGDTLTMLRNVLDVCVARDIKLIYLSSWEVYSGYRSNHLKADESTPLHPKGPYAETKYLCEMLIEHSRRTGIALHYAVPVRRWGRQRQTQIYLQLHRQNQAVPAHCHASL
jgi:UDP-glucuronate decarboxylase